jgi:putative DNA primase/helicase
MAQVAIQTVAHPSTNPLAALGEACTRKDEREVWRVSNELMFEMPHILAVQRRVVQLIDEAFGAQYEDGWWSQLGDDVSEYWASERDNQPERETFDLAVVKGFFEERRVAATVAVAKAIRAEAAPVVEDANALDKAIEKPVETPTPLEPVPVPVVWAQSKLASPPTVSPELPMKNAKSFARDCLLLQQTSEASEIVGEALGTWYYHEEWWQWNGRFYERAPERRILDLVYNYLDNAVVETQDGSKAKLPLKPKHVEDLIKCLKSRVGLHDKDEPPRWLDDQHLKDKVQAENLFVFRNCTVDATTGKVYDLDPRLWFHDGVDYDYDPNAQCPRWERFLAEVFPDDPESGQCLEEFMGLGMTYNNQFEKALGLVGKPRSGKGTIAFILEKLVGPNAHTSLDIHKWTRTENSLQPLIGKKLAIFHDLRAKPPKIFGNVGYDAGGIDHHSAQLLLEMIAADRTTIPRKYVEAWSGNPTWKFLLLSNKVPNFGDETLARERFVWLDFQVNFSELGSMDRRVKHVWLPAELPGIANRCLAGYRRLLERGYLVQPQAGARLALQVQEAVSWPLKFINDCWERDPGNPGPLVSDFFQVFLAWKRENSRFDLQNVRRNNLITYINKLPGWSKEEFHSTKDHALPRRYPGIKRRSEEEC